MFRAKQTKIWRVKEDGYVLWGQCNDGLDKEPKYAYSINKLLKKYGFKQIKVFSGPTFNLDSSNYNFDSSFEEYFDNNWTIDIIVPRGFKCDWRIWRV